MRFRAQLIAGIVAEIVLVIAICAIAIVSLIGTTREANRDMLHALDELVAIHELQDHAQQLTVDARGFLITGDARYVARVRSSQRELARASANLDNIDIGDVRLELASKLNAYSAAVDLVIRDRQANLAAIEELYELRLAPHRRALKETLQEVATRGRADAATTVAESDRTTRAAGVVVTIGSALVIALSILLGVLVARRLSLQFRRVQESRRAASEAAAARQQLLDIVSHDLRAPLNTITLGLDALREEHGELALVRPIENAAHRMQRLVEDLLDAARAQTTGLQLQLSPVDCHELLDLAVESFAERAERAGVELEVEHNVHAPVVVDRDRVIQILSNLVGNALKVTPRGGTITLTARTTETGVRFSVRDSGPGFDSAQAPALFEAYRQGMSSPAVARSGLGLGLYISKTLTHAHGGTIGVETAPAAGSTFWFEIPVRA